MASLLLCCVAFLFLFDVTTSQDSYNCRHGPDKFVLYQNNGPTHCILRTNDSFHGLCMEIDKFWDVLRKNFEEVSSREFHLWESWDAEYKRWLYEHRAYVIPSAYGSPPVGYHKAEQRTLLADQWGFLSGLRLFSYSTPETHRININKEAFGVNTFCQYATRVFPIESIQYYRLLLPTECPVVTGACVDTFKSSRMYAKNDVNYPRNLYKVWYRDANTPEGCVVPKQVHHKKDSHQYCIDFVDGEDLINDQFTIPARRPNNNGYKQTYAIALIRQYWTHFTCYDKKRYACGIIRQEPPRNFFFEEVLPELMRDIRDSFGFEIEPHMRNFTFDGEKVQMGVSTFCNILTEIMPLSDGQLNQRLTECPGQ